MKFEVRSSKFEVRSPKSAAPVRFCNVVVPNTKLDELTYSFDPDVLGELGPGDCVQVPLRGRLVYGVVFGLEEQSPVPNPLPVRSLVERQLVGAGLVALVRWVARYYWSTLGAALNAVLPERVCGYRLRKALPLAEPAGETAGSVSDAGRFTEFDEDRFRVLVSDRLAGRLDLVASFAATRLGRGCVVVLLPERELNEWLPQLAARCGGATAGATGTDTVAYYSGLKPSLRRAAWHRMRRLEHGLVVGVRSAVFAPVPGPAGVAVVDEHDTVYKEERHPRFHARDVAIARARAAGCPVLLCDPTPSAETWHNLRSGAYQWLERRSPAGERQASFIVDMRRHRREVLSPRLRKELERARQSGVALLYVNRVGLSRHVACRDCGNVLRCPDCGVPLVLGTDRTVSCGLCGRRTSAPDTCPACQGAEFQFRAPGVELVAREVESLFAGCSVHRVTAESPEPAAWAIGDVVVGTRALFSRPWPETTRLVAAVCFDYDLILPDFRVRERAFQTLFAMEHRARSLGARLVVQTWRPDDAAIRCALALDAAGFMEPELGQRAQLGFPPARRLALLEFSGRSEKLVLAQVDRALRLAARARGAESLGPVPVGRRGREVAFRMLVKYPRASMLERVLARSRLGARGVTIRADVDPLFSV